MPTAARCSCSAAPVASARSPIQIARQLTALTVIATASRPESAEWAKTMGAHHVVDHMKPLAPQLAAIGFPTVDIVTAFAGTSAHASEIAGVVAPQGHIGVIEGVSGFAEADFGQLFQKSIGLHFELMFTRPGLGTDAMLRQHEILDRVAQLVDDGTLRTTMTKRLAPIGAATLREAHALVESGRMIGKVVVEGWPA